MSGGFWLALKDKELSHRVIDHDCRDNIGGKCIGCENSKSFDEKAHKHGTEKDTDT